MNDSRRISSNAPDSFDVLNRQCPPLLSSATITRHVLKTPGEYARDTGTTVPQLKKYFKHSDISDIVQAYPLPGAHRRGQGGGNTPDAAQEKEARRVFTHFVLGLLNPNPWKRWTPKQVHISWGEIALMTFGVNVYVVTCRSFL